ncbi:MAG: beta-propeller domain-containing protein [Polyangiaceae bacterium]|nr:beta-propeller domain-containing protein [Polyangiaceae bacterium]
MFTRTKKYSAWSLIAITLGAAAIGCSSTPSDEGADGFISDSPFGGIGRGGEDASAGTGGGEMSPGNDNNSGDGGAQKAIQEADIIQVEGNKLYALSQYGGLSIIDMSNPSNLSMLGHYPIQGTPFEMYLQGGVVYAMFSSFGQWECDANYINCNYIQSSHIEALNVQNPANIVQIGTFDLPGEISDSRIVGDVLYAVSYENGYCWNCADTPTTTVTSINVANPADIAVVDSVGFDSSDPNGYGWGRRSVTVTPDRMFIAGIEWDGNSQGHSTIQIVDIADPGGVLHVGASVEAKGMIESRWQMDEHQGVLRVISQPGLWENGVPTVQTFQINSSDSISPMASLDLTLPKPERLRSARFDGTKLYAITAEQTDPLFTIDVSNPAQPVQMGELELPGWIYHLEPRGDRLFALGYDNANPEGSMNVSLFDVSNFANPTLINRVAFGGDWSWAPEDQDRIHKAFKIDMTLGAIFVPYGAYSWNEENGYYGCSQVESGIQIVDFTLNSLTKRGMAPLDGFARRALIHQGKLFSVSDSEVSSYDITNRDNPSRLDRIGLSAWVNQSALVGSHIVRVSADWWTSAATLDVVPANDPSRVEALGRLDLKDVVGSEDDNDCYGWGYFYGAQLYSLDQSRVAIAWSTYPYYYWDEAGGGGSSVAKTHVVVVNIANPAAPIVEGRVSMPFSTEMWSQWGSLDGGQAIVQIGNKLVFRRIQRSANGAEEQAWLETVDLSNPAMPVQLASRKLPDGTGHSLLIKNGSHVLTSHWEPVPGQGNKVKFYLDSVSYASGQPGAVSSKNVPGALLAYDAASTHALTIDYKRISVPVQNPDTCYQTYGWNTWLEESGGSYTCSYMEQTLKLIDVNANNVTVLDTDTLDNNVSFYGTRVTESRVFSQSYRYTANSSEYSVFVIGDISGNSIQSAWHDLPQQDYMWAVAAQDDRLVLASGSKPGIHVLDATDLADMTLAKKGDVTNYVQNVTLDGNSALCAMGPYGLEVIDIQ